MRKEKYPHMENKKDIHFFFFFFFLIFFPFDGPDDDARLKSGIDDNKTRNMIFLKLRCCGKGWKKGGRDSRENREGRARSRRGLPLASRVRRECRDWWRVEGRLTYPVTPRRPPTQVARALRLGEACASPNLSTGVRRTGEETHLRARSRYGYTCHSTNRSHWTASRRR